MTETQQSNDTFADRLRQLRMERGLTQGELSRETGINQAIISRYESGLIPQAKHITLLTNFFGVDFDQFAADPTVSKITELVLQLPQPKRVEVLEFARFKVLAA